jgi:triacylglycerol lipase
MRNRAPTARDQVGAPHAGGPSTAVRASDFAEVVARVEQVRGDGPAAVTEVANIVAQHVLALDAVMAWLARHRGNQFTHAVSERISRRGAGGTLHPVVLIHGFNAGPSAPAGFDDAIAEGLRADGSVVFEVAVEPFHSAKVRAQTLAYQLELILRRTGASKLNLIGHSMGGLTARYLISSMGWGDRVASLSTVATPHRGADAADLVNRLPYRMDALVDLAAGLLGRHTLANATAHETDVRACMNSLSRAAATAFNAENEDVAGVFYQSWAGVATPSGRLDPEGLRGLRVDQPTYQPGRVDQLGARLRISDLVTGLGKPDHLDDGVVGVESARWGYFRGVLTADHEDLVTPSETARAAGFDVVEFYRRVASELRARGY